MASDQRFTLRLSDDLREALAAEAQRQMRSLNAEIKVRLRQSLARARKQAAVRSPEAATKTATA